ncbi:twin-arginine translocation signal domain-containing protein, partial [Salmonella enterica]
MLSRRDVLFASLAAGAAMTTR